MGSARRLILRWFLSFQAVVGATMGLYLYVYAESIIQSIRNGGVDQQVPVFGVGFGPSEWSVAALAWLTLCIAFLELPCGVLGDTFGRKFSLAASLVCRAAFFAAFTILDFLYAGPGGGEHITVILAFMGMTMLAGFVALSSGTLNAWLADEISLGEGKRELTQSLLNRVITRGQVFKWGGFILGAFASFAFYRLECHFVGYALAMLLSFALATLMVKGMPEHRPHEPVEWTSLMASLGRALEIAKRGIDVFFERTVLWHVAALSAAAWSLFYLLDSLWIPFFQQNGGTEAADSALDNLTVWVPLLLTFTIVHFAGSFGVSILISKTGLGKLIKKPGSLGQFVSLLIVLFALPVALLAFTQGALGVSVPYGWILGLLIFHKVADGALQGPLESLEVAYVPEATVEKATVLSAISMVRSLFCSPILIVVVYLKTMSGTSIGASFFRGIDGLWLIASVLSILVAASFLIHAKRYR